MNIDSFPLVVRTLIIIAAIVIIKLTIDFALVTTFDTGYNVIMAVVE